MPRPQRRRKRRKRERTLEFWPSPWWPLPRRGGGRRRRTEIGRWRHVRRRRAGGGGGQSRGKTGWARRQTKKKKSREIRYNGKHKAVLPHFLARALSRPEAARWREETDPPDEPSAARHHGQNCRHGQDQSQGEREPPADGEGKQEPAEYSRLS